MLAFLLAVLLGGPAEAGTGGGIMGGTEGGQAFEVVLDTGHVRAPVNPLALGINLDYLVDDDANRPAGTRPLAEALRELGVRVLRYPGGDKSDTHLWSVAPFGKPSPALATHGDWDWPAMDKTLMMPDRRTWKTKPMDFDAFVRIARGARAEAVVVVPVDPAFRTPDGHHESVPMDMLVRTAAEWVRYAKESGFPVRCWEIGNESFFETGATTYAEAVVRYAKAMKAEDPEARIGAVGVYGEDVGREDRKAGVTTPWNKAVLEAAGGYLDYLIVHDYPVWGWKSFGGYRQRTPDFTAGIKRTRDAVLKWGPADRRDRIGVALTEYGAIDYEKGSWPNVTDLGHALVLAEMIGQYLSEPALDMALMWNTRWAKPEIPIAVHDALDPANRLTPTGMALSIWGKSQGEVMLEAAGDPMLGVFATWTSGKKALCVVMINKADAPREVSLSIRPAGRVSGERWQFSGTGPEDQAPAWKKRGKVKAGGGRLSVLLPGVSLTGLFLRL